MANFLGTSGADILNANTSGNDLVSAAAGDDTLVYEFGKAGGADTYRGGTGTDKMELRFTSAEWNGLSSAIKSSIISMKSAVATASANGPVAPSKNFGTLNFGNGKTVAVYEVESLKIFIDDVESDGVTPAPNSLVTITSANTAGTVVENSAISASGVINFTDANVADTHTVSFTSADGQTALGTFVLGAVSEGPTTAPGAVSWTYNLDAAAAESLTEDQEFQEIYTVSITDGKGSTVTKEITVTIKGTYDAPPVITTNEGEVTEAGIDEDGSAVSGPAVAKGKLANDGAPASAVWSVVDGEGVYGDLTVTDGVWTYTLDNNRDTTGALIFGETVPDTFMVQASFTDVNGDEQIVEQEITLTVYGTNDQAEIAFEGTQDMVVVEDTNVDVSVGDDIASGVLTVTDADAGQAAFEAGTKAGTYGDLTISADGVWTYVLNNDKEATQKLKNGDEVTDTVVVYSVDGSASQAISISVVGSEDSGSISIDEEYTTDLEVTEAGGIKNADDSDLAEITFLSEVKVKVNANGKFTLSDDPDSATASFKALTTDAPVLVNTFAEDDEGALVAVDTNEDGELTDDDKHLETAAGSSKGVYGDFTLDTKTGEWTYKLREDAADKLAAGATAEDKLVVFSADGLVSSTITVTITGSDDAVTSIKGTPVDSVTKEIDQAALAANPDTYVPDLEANGTLEAVDPDGSDAAPEFVVDDAKTVANYGTFGDLIPDDANPAVVSWTYTLDAEKAEALKAGETKTEKLVVVSGGASHVVTVSVKGSDDAATFETGAEEDSEVVEAGGVSNDVNLDSEASGTVAVADVDAGQSSWSAASLGTKKGDFGTFTLALAKDEAGKAIADQLTWTYKLDNSADNVQKLQADNQVEDTVEVVSADGTKHTISVDVFGSNDEAIISVVSAEVLVKEAGGANNKTLGDATAKGQLKLVDPDDINAGEFDAVLFEVGSSFDAEGSTSFADLAPTELSTAVSNGGKIQGTFGAFTFDAVSGKWGYTLDEKLANQLDANQKAVDSLVVYSGDSSSSEQINVHITGAGDNASITNILDEAQETPASVQAGGLTAYVADKASTPEDEEVLPETIEADVEAGGQIMGIDPDAGNPGDEAADFASTLTFAAVAAKSLVGKYGAFTFESTGEAAGTWTYTLDTTDADTKLLTAADPAKQDKLTVKEADGTLYTISVDVKGANDQVVLAEGGDAVIDSTGKISYTVVDGDAGKLSLFIGADVEAAKVYTAATVIDGKVSTFSAPTTAGTTVTQGLMFVSDNTKGHEKVALETYVGLGTNAANTLDAAEAGDTAGALLAGYGGNDALIGGGNNDYLDGGSGNDSVNGGAGDDIVVGGTGNDVLAGGEGADTFLFMTTAAMGATNADTITDFISGEDTLQLGKALLPSTYFKLVEGDVTAAKAFTGQDGAVAKGAITEEWFRDDLTVSSTGKVVGTLTAEDRFVFDAVTGTLWYDADGKSTTAAVKVAVFGGDSEAPQASDFQFV